MASHNTQRKVLVVDDEPQVLTAIRDTLEDHFQVFVESSPLQAVKLLRERTDLSVILSDQRMPEMSGNEFLARARELCDAARLLITGYADLEAVIRAVNEGHIFGYISKPWSPDGLRLAVIKAVEHHELTRKLSEEQRLLHNLMTCSPDGIFFKDTNHRFIRLNAVEAERLNVARPEDIIEKTLKDVMPRARALAIEAEDSVIFKNGIPVKDRIYQVEMSDGSNRWFSTSKAPVKDDKGRVVSLVGITRDVTERKKQEERISRLSRIHEVLSGINTTIVRVKDPDTLFNEACRIAVEHGRFRMAWIGIFDPQTGNLRPAAIAGVEDGYLSGIKTAGSGGVSEGEGVTLRIRKHKNPIVCNDIEREWSESAARLQALQRGYRSTARLPLVVGGEQLGVLTLYSGQTGFFDSEEMKLLEEMAGDISFALEHIEKERRANYLAYYDALTELPNRQLFFDRLEQRVVASRRDKTSFAVIMLDVERFRLINETLGRQAGDELLRQLARRVQGELQETAIPGRLAADRFGIVTRRDPEVVDVAHMLEQLLSNIRKEPFVVGGKELRVAARAGVAAYPLDGEDADALYKNAEAALRNAKNTGEPLRFYAPQMNARVAERLNLENRLRQAVEHEEFVLHYQPKFSLDTGRISGVEALIRWAEPNGTLVAPGMFIPVLEETGMILEVGKWVLRQALSDFARWHAAGIGGLRVAVNVSPVQLKREGFVAEILEATEKAGAHTSTLELEITESLVMEDIEQNIAKLKAIRELGVAVSIDDFGTGYSSLSYIAKLPINALKIDRSFVVGIADHPDNLSIVQSIISLAHSLRLNVVAEGVDSGEQEKLLRLLRCDEVQGFLFGKPLPADATLDLLRKQFKERS